MRLSEKRSRAALAAALFVAPAAMAALPATSLAQDASSAAVAPAASTTSPASARNVRIKLYSSRLQVRAGRLVRVAGRVTNVPARTKISLQVRRGRVWKRLDSARTSSSGRYTLTARPRRAGRYIARLVVPKTRNVPRRVRRLGPLTVYRVTHASWYGPGLYGNHLGCGGRLYRGTAGVAHKTLPCGTRVTLRHRGRTVSVRVIDRGPYIAGREYDLTSATAARLGFRGHGALLVSR